MEQTEYQIMYISIYGFSCRPSNNGAINQILPYADKTSQHSAYTWWM